ncbi:MAG: hypothetical protein LLG06_19105, partial [Desulfobacteraceae bacterium]|nr:hypothetical protein [Desulfobacteraceae bacterium]
MFKRAGMSVAVALCMVVVACGVASAGAGPPVKAVVAATGGDGFELTTTKGQMYVGSAKGYIGNTYLMGWRFENIAIPKGAQITSATLDLYAIKGASGTVNVRFYGDASGDAADIAVNRYNLSGRTATTASLNATLTSWNKAQTWYKSPDLTAIVQEIVQRSDWQYGNALAILCANRGTKGKITLYNIEQNVMYAPQLTITYNMPQTAAPPWDIDLDGDTIPDLTLYDGDADGYYELPCGKLEFFGTLTIDKPVEVPGCVDSTRGLSIIKGDGIVIASGGIIISDLDSPVVSSPDGTKGNDIQIIGRNFVTMGAGA